MSLWVITQYHLDATASPQTLTLTTQLPTSLVLGLQPYAPSKSPRHKIIRGLPIVCGWYYRWQITSCLTPIEPQPSLTHTWLIPHPDTLTYWSLPIEGATCDLPAPSGPPIPIPPPTTIPVTVTDSFARPNAPTLGNTESPILPWVIHNADTWEIRDNAAWPLIMHTTWTNASIDLCTSDATVTVTVHRPGLAQSPGFCGPALRISDDGTTGLSAQWIPNPHGQDILASLVLRDETLTDWITSPQFLVATLPDDLELTITALGPDVTIASPETGLLGPVQPPHSGTRAGIANSPTERYRRLRDFTATYRICP